MPETVAPGRVLGGRYRLTRELARGGMATVWDAQDPLLSRRVAVKILHPELAIDDAVRARFRHEAVAAAKLSHPAIVATYDTGDDGVAYIVMQLVEGPTLRRMLDRRGPLPPGEAADVAAQVAEALDHAHRHSLVHRDIKPANVLVPPDGQIKVTDFGIAKATGDEDLTRTGTVVGTARYLAPEQVSGDAVDGRADVYALGLVLYEMLAGVLPFTGESEITTAMARLTRAPDPVRTHRPDVPPMLDAIVSRCLERDPDDRFPSAGALLDALEPAREPPSGSLPAVARTREPATTAADRTVGVDRTATATATPPPSPPPSPPPARAAHRRRRWPRGLVALLVLAAVGVVAYAGVRALTDDGGGGGGGVTTPAGPVTIVGADDFDPLGDDQEENQESAGNVFDGNPRTAWETEQYQAPAQEFGGAKDGVGIFVELDGVDDLSTVTVTADEAGWSAEVYVADQPGADLAAWGQTRGTVDDAGTTADIALRDGTRGRYVLVWLTRLPPSGKLRVSDIRVA
ncbi:MAG: protein kinase domain-containing protein [Acidimicrobiia bacterium]